MNKLFTEKLIDWALINGHQVICIGTDEDGRIEAKFERKENKPKTDPRQMNLDLFVEYGNLR